MRALGALATAPSTTRVLLFRAQLLTDSGELWAAETLYVNLLARASEADNRTAWLGISNVLSRQERHPDLVEVLTRVLEPRDSQLPEALLSTLHTLRGSARERLPDFGLALVDYEAAIELNPNEIVALNNAAWLIHEIALERIDEARRFIDTALELAPENRSVLDTAAVVYLALGRREQALEYAERALAKERKPEYLIHRAKALRELGRDSEARKSLVEVLESSPGTNAAAQASRLLSDFQ